jgi:hypothetical protein
MKNLKKLLILISISFIILGCAPEGKHNPSDGDSSESEETTTTPPEKPVSEEQKIEKMVSSFFGISLKLGDSFTCISGRCQKSNKRECPFQVVERGYGREMNTSNMNFPKPSETPPNECHFTMTNLGEATDIPGSGQQWGPQRLMILCSNSKYDFEIPHYKHKKIGPKIFYIFGDEKGGFYVLFMYTWNTLNSKYNQHGTTPGRHIVNRKIVKERFDCLQ